MDQRPSPNRARRWKTQKCGSSQTEFKDDKNNEEPNDHHRHSPSDVWNLRPSENSSELTVLVPLLKLRKSLLQAVFSSLSLSSRRSNQHLSGEEPAHNPATRRRRLQRSRWLEDFSAGGAEKLWSSQKEPE